MNGITDYIRALKFLFHRKVFLFAIIPGLLALVFSTIMFFVIKNYSDDIGSWMWGWYKWEWGRAAIETGATWISGIIMLAVSIFLFKYIILIVSSPFMSSLSERVETILTGENVNQPLSMSTMTEGLMRGLRISFRNIFRELGLSVVLLILSLFPVFAPFTSIALLTTQAYFAGFGNLDFSLERYFNVRESVAFVRDHKVYTLGNGIVFIGLLLIPVIGAVIAVPLGTAAATIGVVERT